MKRGPVSLRGGQTCFFMVFHAILRQISNFCFCAIFSFLSVLFFTFFQLCSQVVGIFIPKVIISFKALKLEAKGIS